MRDLLLVLPPARRWQLVVIFLLAVVAAAFEFLIIFLVVPSLEHVFHSVGVDRGDSPLMISLESSELIFGLFMSVILGTGTRLYLSFYQTRFVFQSASDITIRILGGSLSLPLEDQLSRDIDRMTATLTNRINQLLLSVFLPIITFITNAFLAIGVIAALVQTSLIITIVLLSFLVIIYLVIAKVFADRFLSNSKYINNSITDVQRTLRNVLSNPREVLSYGLTDHFLDLFAHQEGLLRRAQYKNIFFSTVPRILIEGLLIIAALGFLMIIGSGGNFVSLLSIGGGFAIGVQKLIPYGQRAFVAWSSFRGGLYSIKDIDELIENLRRVNCFSVQSVLEEKNGSLTEFFQQISVRDLKITLPGRGRVSALSYPNFSVSKGQLTLIRGENGRGKTKLLDYLAGLLGNTSGFINADQNSQIDPNAEEWRERIFYLDVAGFIFDGTIRDNITLFGRYNSANEECYRKAIEMSLFEEVCEERRIGPETLLSSTGLGLSAGQRQKLLLARAINSNKEIILLDEPTSSIDQAGEREILSNLRAFSKNRFVIMVAHTEMTNEHFFDNIISL